MSSVKVLVPASTSNLGPGFDCLGVALSLQNVITVTREAVEPPTGMIAESAEAFFETSGKSFGYSVSVEGDVPRSRGLGSSVTVRAGVVAGLNALAGEPLTMAECLNLVTALEGHPDNAAPAFLGGFTVCAEGAIFRCPVASKLKFVAVIPDFEVETSKARGLLPKELPFADAVENNKQTALIAAAFASSKYELLRGAFADRLHQPYRKPLIPMLDKVIEAAETAGALGGFLSGSGSTIIALTLQKPEAVKKAMLQAMTNAGAPAHGVVLTADNRGIQVKAIKGRR